MTRGQWVLSCLIAAHMTAVFVGAMPNLDDFGMSLEQRIAEPPVPAVAAALDAASVRLIWLHRATWSVVPRAAEGSNGLPTASGRWLVHH